MSPIILSDKQRSLRSAKRFALSLLVFAACIFLLTSLSPHFLSAATYHQWALLIQCLQTMAEAAMVGGLADWFAVSALFKPVPIPLLSRHTNIIPKNKDQIAKNLSEFIQDKFLEPQSLTRMIEQKNPAHLMAAWLLQSQNSRKLSKLLLALTQKVFALTDDKIVQGFLGHAIRTALNEVNFSGAASVVLQTLIKEGRHHALLDQVLQQMNHLLANEQTQTLIAEGIVDWLKDNHPMKEKILPSELIGKKGAKLAIATVSHLLNEVTENPEHHLRHEFDAYTHRMIQKLAQDPSYIARGESIKNYILTNTTFNAYIGDIWQGLKNWIDQDIRQPDSVLEQQAYKLGIWLGETIEEDVELQMTINREISQLSQDILPKLGQLLSDHIQTTVQDWDSQLLSEQIELNIGKDLQKIRINGTLLGACIGFILFVISHIQMITQWLM